MNFKEKKILVTGGAGFIGSNLCKSLLDKGAFVRVLDNLITGNHQNIEPFLEHPNFEFLEGDICSVQDCYNALEGIDAISHQAALGSVPRSIEHPHRTHSINATGFLNMLHAAKEKGVKRFVYASSSSVYGDAIQLPKREGEEGNPISPYAVTKKLNEQYAKVYFDLHGMEVVGLRYFNVFGPNQDPDGVYAAAIPKFLAKMRNGDLITVNGDGEQTRDFTYVKNAVQANERALISENQEAFGKVYNVACGDALSLNKVIESLAVGLKKLNQSVDLKVKFGPERAGDVKHSLANISAITSNLGYQPKYTFQEGINEYLESL
ncbi:MAG: NAD-dependent epimerase/dehydratase family protein [Lishizhenia sp.]